MARDYLGLLVSEISRVVPQGGLVFGINSPFIGGLREYGFRHIVCDFVTMDYQLTRHNGIHQKFQKE